MMQYRYGKISVIVAALVLPISVSLSSAVSLVFKSRNPGNVNILTNLAYVRPILGTLLISFALLLIIGIVFAGLGLKKDADKHLAKVGLILLIVITLLSLIAGGLQKKTSHVEDTYLKVQTQDFFKKISR